MLGWQWLGWQWSRVESHSGPNDSIDPLGWPRGRGGGPLTTAVVIETILQTVLLLCITRHRQGPLADYSEPTVQKHSLSLSTQAWLHTWTDKVGVSVATRHLKCPSDRLPNTNFGQRKAHPKSQTNDHEHLIHHHFNCQSRCPRHFLCCASLSLSPSNRPGLKGTDPTSGDGSVRRRQPDVPHTC